MKRPDAHILEQVARLYGSTAHCKRLIKLYLDDVLTMPYFVISEQHLDEVFGEDNYVKPEYRVNAHSNEELLAVMPFRTFILHIPEFEDFWLILDYDPENVFHLVFPLATIMRSEEVPETGTRAYSLVHVIVDETSRYPGPERQHRYTSSIKFQILEFDNDYARRLNQKIPTDKVLNDFFERALEKLIGLLEGVAALFISAQTMHLTEVVSEKPKVRLGSRKAAKKLWLRDDTPHYIFINSPKDVTPRKRCEGEPHYRVRGHHRRGFMRRLTADCYKDNPHYGGFIPVRPTWVGSREWTTGGKIYTVRDVDDKNLK